jgi:2-methylaconitate cis-trans-isomerase PrpF
VLFRREDLPDDPHVRDRMILASMGSPDIRQIDGVGGAHPLTSKVAIVEPAGGRDLDVLFTFGQVAVDRPVIDYSGTCGNISAAVGTWAVDEGVVAAGEPTTPVRVLNTNTDKVFIAHVPVRGGSAAVRGDFHLDGVPNPGARVRLEFLRPAGSVTGSLLPTGRAQETLSSGAWDLRVSILDVGNPTVLVPIEELGLAPDEVTGAIGTDRRFRDLLLAIREAAGRTIGLADDDGRVPAHIPKVAILAPSSRYTSLSGQTIDGASVDVRAWALTMGQLHQAYPVTAALPTAVGLHIEGSVAWGLGASPPSGVVRIGHPSGVLEVESTVTSTPNGPVVERVIVPRTARKIMAGEILLP